MVAETSLEARQLLLPMFVAEGVAEPQPISSMPGVVQHTRDSLRKAAAEAADAGLGGLMLFGIPADEGRRGLGGDRPGGILNVAIADVMAEVGDAVTVMSDLCLDEFTDHGHCGVLDADGRVDNDATLAVYAAMAVAQAAAGVHVVAPERHDGRPGRCDPRRARRGRRRTSAILAYSAKYASAFYGPFREAVDSSLESATGAPTSRTRPTPSRRARGALDLAEGADIVMVKPALAYLDVVRRVRDAVDVPVAAYQVSGEYAMVEAAAANGLDRPGGRDHRDAHLDPARGRRHRADLLGPRSRGDAGLSPPQRTARPATTHGSARHNARLGPPPRTARRGRGWVRGARRGCRRGCSGSAPARSPWSCPEPWPRSRRPAGRAG